MLTHMHTCTYIPEDDGRQGTQRHGLDARIDVHLHTGMAIYHTFDAFDVQ